MMNLKVVLHFRSYLGLRWGDQLFWSTMQLASSMWRVEEKIRGALHNTGKSYCSLALWSTQHRDLFCQCEYNNLLMCWLWFLALNWLVNLHGHSASELCISMWGPARSLIAWGRLEKQGMSSRRKPLTCQGKYIPGTSPLPGEIYPRLLCANRRRRKEAHLCSGAGVRGDRVVCAIWNPLRLQSFGEDTRDRFIECTDPGIWLWNSF